MTGDAAERPDPDALLRRVTAEANQRRRGKLKIFFGATAGVGKTYAMLEAARKHRAEGRDVVIGWVETHGRQETAALLEGLERLPPRAREHRGVRLDEFDIDAALLRRPGLLLLDELAHTNAPGSRHAKRWQDVVELLDAGIDVDTTLNVQHLESLNDVVAQITGVTVRETLPDSVLEQADEVEIIDLPPDELLARLREGKVYVPEQAQRAISSFFRKGNLIALRELALRRTAERVDLQMRDYRRDHGIAATWPAAERILVCVGPNPAAARLIRAARRMAAGLRAEWIAIYVEAPSHARLPDSDLAALAENMRLVEALGGRSALLAGHDVAHQILAYAREHNVTRIVAGKPTHSRWRDRLSGSLMDELLRGSGDIDVHVISGDPEAEEPRRARPMLRPTSPPSAYAAAVAIVLLTSALAWAMFPLFAPTNLAMVYLLGVAFVANRSSRGPAALASVLSVAAFDFFFVPPYLTFAVADTQYVLTFVVMLVVALLISTLATRARQQAEALRQREARTAVLYAMSRDLAAARTTPDIGSVAARHVAEVASAGAQVLSPTAAGALAPVSGPAAGALDPSDEGVARWAFDNARPAGLGTDTLPGSRALFLPLVGTGRALGVLSVRPEERRAFSPDQMHLLEALARQTSAALERAQLAEEAEHARLDVEAERLRTGLLSSVSHDLRTPLASIMGAASGLIESATLGVAERRDLAQTIHEEADRLNRLVANLLDMTRLESGGLRARKEWVPLEEVVGTAIERAKTALGGRAVKTLLPEDLPLVPMDPILVEQALVNLLENAARHTPPSAPIDIAAGAEDGWATVEVLDRGPGLPDGAAERLFEKFYRGPGAAPGGSGLGLAICRGIGRAHGGDVTARSREGGGAVFALRLPLEAPPAPPPAEESA